MSDSLGFLISDVSRLMRRRFDERARTIGLTRAKWRTLKILSRHEGINQGKLADLLEVEPITLCRMIDRLEESSLVERRRDPGDRRAWCIYLTDQAAPMLDQLRDLADGMTDMTLEGLDEARRAELADALSVIHRNLNLPTESSEADHG